MALELSCGGDHELWDFDTLQVTITLSEKGLVEYERVIEIVFSYA